LKKIAATGGVVGIGYWKEAVCGTAPADVARAIRYVVDLIGDDHVALGSDYDGGTTVAFDASQIAVVTQAMLDAGLSEDSVRKVLGENALRVLTATLPP
jgi:microsomal dipeptidase-like Zn-dependent dipeptidase